MGQGDDLASREGTLPSPLGDNAKRKSGDSKKGRKRREREIESSEDPDDPPSRCSYIDHHTEMRCKGDGRSYLRGYCVKHFEERMIENPGWHLSSRGHERAQETLARFRRRSKLKRLERLEAKNVAEFGVSKAHYTFEESLSAEEQPHNIAAYLESEVDEGCGYRDGDREGNESPSDDIWPFHPRSGDQGFTLWPGSP